MLQHGWNWPRNKNKIRERSVQEQALKTLEENAEGMADYKEDPEKRKSGKLWLRSQQGGEFKEKGVVTLSPMYRGSSKSKMSMRFIA